MTFHVIEGGNTLACTVNCNRATGIQHLKMLDTCDANYAVISNELVIVWK